MNSDTPKFTPEQELANKWVADNWHTGLKISATDTNFSSFYAFLAGYENAQSASASRIEKLEWALREGVRVIKQVVELADVSAPVRAMLVQVGSHLNAIERNEMPSLVIGTTEENWQKVDSIIAALNPEETKGGGQ